jgi:hypothetical protein
MVGKGPEVPEIETSPCHRVGARHAFIYVGEI